LKRNEELLNHYISVGESQKIIDLCKKYGDSETNLWV